MKRFAICAALLAVACLASPAQAFHPHHRVAPVRRFVANHHHRAAFIVNPHAAFYAPQAFIAAPVCAPAQFVAPVQGYVQPQVGGCQQLFQFRAY